MILRQTKIALVAGALAAAASLWSGTRAQAVNILDQFPSNARMCVVMNNLAGVDHKIKVLAGEMNLPVNSDPLSMMEQNVGIGSGLNDQGSAGVVFLQPTPNHPNPMVVLFPITHVRAAFAKDSISKADAQGICTISAPDGSPGYVARHGGFAVVAQHRSALQAYLASVAWGMRGLTPADAKDLGISDFACYVNVPALRKQILARLNKMQPLMMDQLRMKLGNSKTSAFALLVLNMELRAVRQMIRQSHAVLLMSNITPSGVELKIALNAVPGSAVAKLIAAQPPLPAKPLLGLPGGRFLAVGAMTSNGRSLVAWLDKILAQAAQDKSITTLPGFAKARLRLQTQLATMMKAGNSTTSSEVLYPVGPKEALMHGLLVQQTSGNAAAVLAANMIGLGRMYGPGGMALPHGNVAVKLQPNAFVLDGVNFDRMTMHISVPDNPALPDAGVAQSVIASIYGRHGTQVDMGAVDRAHVVAGVNVSRRELAKAIAAVRMRQDVLDGQREITAQASHVLPHPQMVAYLPLDAWVRLAMDRMSAANGGAPPPQAGAGPVNPVTISLGIHGPQVAGQVFIPTDQLKALAADGRAVMMMVMMSMMNGQQPPPPPDAPGNQGG